MGRVHSEPDDETRLPFQRDRDRIIHTRAFRRLKGKTQVFVEGHGDHVRTRLTHTMEVVQISRDIARTLQVNEDLTECIALAHDLGHPPFGHAGEDALNDWMKKSGGKFEHNEQSHRIVTLLEDHSSLYKGLNLNQEVLDGLLKHTTPHDLPRSSSGGPTLEAQIVNLADEIAYTGHDCEDGIRANLFTLEDILSVPLAKRAYERTRERGTSLRGSIIHILVMDLYNTTQDNLPSQRIKTIEDIYNHESLLVQFSPSMTNDLNELREFLEVRMYMSNEVIKKSSEGKKIITLLCEHLMNNPSEKVLKIQAKSDSALNEAVKDFVAGMTDQYAVDQTTKIGVSS
ncbi:dNTP triphosphohydrolase [Patescibacteria group bacterium]|nr:dNTP triphosphohydrolase [Patescibacteria group bacterium]MBU1123433.1 dNTP triphosphohydrolase [Patescibacteria group bacterium]MBU1911763.1 dNTP triphosphohydrolase [Patescibacteria group bacterium]